MSVSRRRSTKSSNDRPRSRVAGRFASTSTLLLTAWSVVGCYAYIPVAPSPQPTGAATGAVRVTLSPAGTEFFRQSLGNNVLQLEGTLTRSTPDTVVLAVERTSTSTGESFVSQGQVVAVPRQLAAEVVQKQYSRKRSIGLGAIIVSALVIVLATVSGSSGSASGGGPTGPPQP